MCHCLSACVLLWPVSLIPPFTVRCRVKQSEDLTGPIFRAPSMPTGGYSKGSSEPQPHKTPARAPCKANWERLLQRGLWSRNLSCLDLLAEEYPLCWPWSKPKDINFIMLPLLDFVNLYVQLHKSSLHMCYNRLFETLGFLVPYLFRIVKLLVT